MRRLATLLVAATILPLVLSLAPRSGGPLPRMLFVIRNADSTSDIIPGVGPLGRLSSAPAVLMVREANGLVRPFLRNSNRFFLAVSDPAVSYDARWVAFAAIAPPDSCWRIYRCSAAGDSVVRLTDDSPDADPGQRYGRDAAIRYARFDDFDPCWMPDGRIVFASTRFPMRAPRGERVSNLWTMHADGSERLRITSERNGAEEPSIDPTSSRIVYARWWFNPYRASDVVARNASHGFDGALPADSVDLWHAISSERDGDLARLQGGDARHRSGQWAYQPVVLSDTTLVGVISEAAGLASPGRLGLQSFDRGIAPARPLAGYGAPIGHSACSPVGLPDGRIVFSMDADGTGDWGLYIVEANGRGLSRVFDRPGSLELDAAVLAPRRLPPRSIYPEYNPHAPEPLPPISLAQILASEHTVRFDCLNVFANAPIDAAIPDAPKLQQGLRIRFFTTIVNADGSGQDSLVVVDEQRVNPQGGVFVDRAPADQPMFEQLIDAHGHVVRSTAGPAHVAGFNAARPGGGTKCVGCHVGHSQIFVETSRGRGQFTNVSTSATVTASSQAVGTLGPMALIDRKTRGAWGEVAWVAGDPGPQWVRLAWQVPIESKGIRLYRLERRDRAPATSQRGRLELTLYSAGAVVRHQSFDREWRSNDGWLGFPLTRIDAMELRYFPALNRGRDPAPLALAEIETIARIAWE
ncbi:MAG: hypothetical protein HOP12_08785 [Candidatus Eisenbacteria bacterium]|uniref:Hydrazine synthase alpha subunit middle domain-containing protein n=1 Tax=Eiseniibacteriota bacterium TaxID=2212470 RepID=A0A849SEU3_UNCEI|nr:hypothetical protein [Candidatus Eisenbacteria bacterium]